MARAANFVCVAAWGLIVLHLSSQLGCARSGDERPTAASLNPNSSSTEGDATIGNIRNIREILDDWSAGRADVAIDSLLKLAESSASDADFRPILMSETTFVNEYTQQVSRTSHEEAGEWAKRELAGCTALMDLSRELVRRARIAQSTADDAAAKRLFLCLKRVGNANVGNDEEVCKMVNLVGRSLIKEADEGLVLIASKQSTSASSRE